MNAALFLESAMGANVQTPSAVTFANVPPVFIHLPMEPDALVGLIMDSVHGLYVCVPP